MAPTPSEPLEALLYFGRADMTQSREGMVAGARTQLIALHMYAGSRGWEQEVELIVSFKAHPLWSKRNTPPLLVGLQAGTTTLEISLAVPQKTGHNTT